MTKHLFTEFCPAPAFPLSQCFEAVSRGRVVINHIGRARAWASQCCAWPPMWPQMSHQEAIIWCPVVWYFNYHNCWPLLLPSIVSALDGAYKGVGLSINNQNWRESVWFMTEHGATWQGSVLTWRMPSLPCHEWPHGRDDVTWWPSDDLSQLMIQMTLRYSSRLSLIQGQLARVHSNISICLTDFMCLYGPITLCSAKT